MKDRMEVQFKGWCTPEQKRHWQRAADAAKRSLSDWLRLVADAAAEEALGPQEDSEKSKPGK